MQQCPLTSIKVIEVVKGAIYQCNPTPVYMLDGLCYLTTEAIRDRYGHGHG